MTDDRSEHWLWRLDADAWLRAAQVELAAAAANLESRRTAVTHARRAAGMALNAVLVASHEAGVVTGSEPGAELRWGRSYVDHLRALADPRIPISPLPDELRPLAAGLLQIAVMGGGSLVQLGRSAHGPALHALELARQLCERCSAAIATTS